MVGKNTRKQIVVNPIILNDLSICESSRIYTFERPPVNGLQYHIEGPTDVYPNTEEFTLICTCN